MKLVLYPEWKIWDKLFEQSMQPKSQNNYYIVFSRCFGDIIAHTKNIQTAMDADNQFTIVRGYYVS